VRLELVLSEQIVVAFPIVSQDCKTRTKLLLNIWIVAKATASFTARRSKLLGLMRFPSCPGENANLLSSTSNSCSFPESGLSGSSTPSKRVSLGDSGGTNVSPSSDGDLEVPRDGFPGTERRPVLSLGVVNVGAVDDSIGCVVSPGYMFDQHVFWNIHREY
jgi:hypothetical protein